MSVSNTHNMNLFINRSINPKGYYYLPSDNIPHFYVHKYATYNDMIDSLASYINGY